MQNPPIDTQLLKSAIFGMRRRAMDRDNQAFQQQFQNHIMKQLSDMQSQGIPRAQAMQQLQGQQQTRIDQDEQRRNAFDQEMNNMNAQREAFGRASMQPGFRYSRQQPAAQGTAPLRGALSQSERGNDQIIQQQIAANNSRPPAPVQPANQQPNQQPNQNMAGYEQAKSDLLKMNPNLGIAGHADNTNFINSLKSSYGDNYREHLQQNPQLLAQHYSSMQPQNTSQPVASQAARPNPNPTPAPAPAPATSAGGAPSMPIKNSPFTMSGSPTTSPGGSTITPGTGQINPAATNSTPPPMSVPKTARDSSSELLDPESQDTFRKTASMFGLSDYAVEEALHEMTKEKTASSEEGRFMNYLREELFKMAKDMGDHCPYSPKELSSISSSAENFQKAAMVEAQSFWTGLSEDLLKRGRDESFLEGILKAAGDFSEEVGLEADPSAPGGGILSTLGEGAKKLMETGKEHGTEALQGLQQGAAGLGDAAKAVGQSLIPAAQNAGQALGSTAKAVGQAASSAGSEILDTAKETAGRLKEQSGPAMDKLKENAGKALEKGKSAFNDLTSSLTPEDDRHQIIPGVGNQYLGAAGGALLSALLGGQMGLTGPASWLVPLLGGAAGYHYLPKLMNMWKDQPGTGTKAISPGAASFNRNNPIMGNPIPAAPGGGMSPSNNLGALNPKPV